MSEKSEQDLEASWAEGMGLFHLNRRPATLNDCHMSFIHDEATVPGEIHEVDLELLELFGHGGRDKWREQNPAARRISEPVS